MSKQRVLGSSAIVGVLMATFGPLSPGLPAGAAPSRHLGPVAFQMAGAPEASDLPPLPYSGALAGKLGHSLAFFAAVPLGAPIAEVQKVHPELQFEFFGTQWIAMRQIGRQKYTLTAGTDKKGRIFSVTVANIPRSDVDRIVAQLKPTFGVPECQKSAGTRFYLWENSAIRHIGHMPANTRMSLSVDETSDLNLIMAFYVDKKGMMVLP